MTATTNAQRVGLRGMVSGSRLIGSDRTTCDVDALDALLAERDALEARAVAAEAEVARLRALFRDIEWEGHGGLCPDCNGRRPECEGGGHRDGCRVAAEFAKGGAR